MFELRTVASVRTFESLFAFLRDKTQRICWAFEIDRAKSFFVRFSTLQSLNSWTRESNSSLDVWVLVLTFRTFRPSTVCRRFRFAGVRDQPASELFRLGNEEKRIGLLQQPLGRRNEQDQRDEEIISARPVWDRRPSGSPRRSPRREWSRTSPAPGPSIRFGERTRCPEETAGYSPEAPRRPA